MTTDMTPAELKSAREALGLSQARFALLLGAGSDRTVRGWEAGHRNGGSAGIPGTVQVLTRALMESPAVREYFGVKLRARQPGRGAT